MTRKVIKGQRIGRDNDLARPRRAGRAAPVAGVLVVVEGRLADDGFAESMAFAVVRPGAGVPLLSWALRIRMIVTTARKSIPTTTPAII